MRREAIAFGALLLGLITSATPAAMVKFRVMVADGANEGFNDPTALGDTTLGALRLGALQFAADLWSSRLRASHENETIVIQATMDPLADTTLGSTRSEADFHGFGSDHPRYNNQASYGSALANHLKGSDLDANAPEMRLTLNSTKDWYIGTDGMPPMGKPDAVSVLVHEIAHGLNFETRANFDPTQGASFTGNRPGIYDRFLFDSSTNTFLRDMGIVALQAALVSDSVYWDGEAGKAANGGQRPQVFAPKTWNPGSSIAHIDPSAHANDLMTPGGTNVNHMPSSIDLGMLHDMGWDIVPEPGTAVLLILGAVVVGWWRREN